MNTRMRLIAGAGVALAVATVAPAYAANSTGTTVTVSVGSAGTRQLDVLDLTGNPLTNLALTPGVPAPFRVRVTDSGIGNLTDAATGFTVSAVMNNLYKKTGASSYDYTTKIPSSDVAISYNPLSAFGVSFDDLPQIAVGGSIPDCTQLVAAGILQLSDVTTIASSLCSLLPSTGSLTVPTFDVTGALQSVTPSVSNLLDLPFGITGNESGAFTNADYANGIGAGDTSGSGTPTSRKVMQGVPNMTTTLANEITSAIGTLPSTLASVSGTGADTTLSEVYAGMVASGDSTLNSLSSAISSLTQSEQLSLINTYLSGSLLGPVLGDISNVAGTYNAFPMLTANPGSVAAGTYAGTMTITLVQP